MIRLPAPSADRSATTPLWRRLALPVLVIGVIAVLAWRSGAVNWHGVAHALSQLDAFTLIAATLVSLASYAVYASFELLAPAYTGKRISGRLLLPTAFVCYAFNQSLGSLVGSVGLRYRLYSQFGLDLKTTTGIIVLSFMTNWSGYLLIAGLAWLFRYAPLPPGWRLGSAGLQLCGVALLATLLAYLAACALLARRTYIGFGVEFRMPSLKMALLQVALSTISWLLMAAVLFVLFRERAGFLAILAIFLLCSVAAAFTHVPAGLGVVEGIFLSLLGSVMPSDEIMADMLAYRAIYYFVPFTLAALAYLVLEVRARRVADGGLVPHGDPGSSRAATSSRQ